MKIVYFISRWCLSTQCVRKTSIALIVWCLSSISSSTEWYTYNLYIYICVSTVFCTRQQRQRHELVSRFVQTFSALTRIQSESGSGTSVAAIDFESFFVNSIFQSCYKCVLIVQWHRWATWTANQLRVMRQRQSWSEQSVKIHRRRQDNCASMISWIQKCQLRATTRRDNDQQHFDLKRYAIERCSYTCHLMYVHDFAWKSIERDALQHVTHLRFMNNNKKLTEGIKKQK